MGQQLVKKPGYMTRAVIAWFIYNAILIFTLVVIMFIMTAFLSDLRVWYVMVPLLLGVVVSEWIIIADTIAPVIKGWITQETYVDQK